MTDSEKIVIETHDKEAVIDGLDRLLSAYAFDSDEVQAIGGAKYQQMVGHSADDYCSLGKRREGDPDDCIKS